MLLLSEKMREILALGFLRPMQNNLFLYNLAYVRMNRKTTQNNNNNHNRKAKKTKTEQNIDD